MSLISVAAASATSVGAGTTTAMKSLPRKPPSAKQPQPEPPGNHKQSMTSASTHATASGAADSRPSKLASSPKTALTATRGPGASAEVLSLAGVDARRRSNSLAGSSTTSSTAATSAFMDDTSQQASVVPAIDDVVPDVQFRHGDWVCPSYNCSYHNFARNSTCNQCGTHKPLGLAASSSSSSSAGGAGGAQALLKTRNSDGQLLVDGSVKRCLPPSNLPPRLRKLVEMDSAKNAAVAAVEQQQQPLLVSTPPSVTVEDGYFQQPLRAPTRSTHLSVSPSAAVFRPSSSSSSSSSSLSLSSTLIDESKAGLTSAPVTPSHAPSHVTAAAAAIAAAAAAAAVAQTASGNLSASSSSSTRTATPWSSTTPGYMAPTHSTFMHLYQRGIDIGAGANPKPPLANGQGPPIKNTGNVGPMQPQPGDWWCCLCGFTNWRRRRYCMKCFPCADQDPHSTAIKASICLANYLAAAPPNSPMLLHLQQQAALGCASNGSGASTPTYTSMPAPMLQAPALAPLPSPAANGAAPFAAASAAPPMTHSQSQLSSSSSSLSTPSSVPVSMPSGTGEVDGFPFYSFPAFDQHQPQSLAHRQHQDYHSAPTGLAINRVRSRPQLPTSLSSATVHQQQLQHGTAKTRSYDGSTLARSSPDPFAPPVKISSIHLGDGGVLAPTSNDREIWNSSFVPTSMPISIPNNLSTSPWPTLSSSSSPMPSPRVSSRPEERPPSSPTIGATRQALRGEDEDEDDPFAYIHCSETEEDTESSSAALWRNAPIGTVPKRKVSPPRSGTAQACSSSATASAPSAAAPSSSQVFKTALQSPWTSVFVPRNPTRLPPSPSTATPTAQTASTPSLQDTSNHFTRISIQDASSD